MYEWLGMLVVFGGLTEVMSYPHSTIQLQMVVILALWVWVWWTQGDETPGCYTSNSTVLTEDIQANLGCIWLVWMNNEHFPVCLYSYSSRGTKLGGTKSLLPFQAEMEVNCTWAKLDQL